MKLKQEVVKVGAKGFTLAVLPNKDQLDEAISQNGRCSPTECWHYVAIAKLMEEMAPGERHHVRVDAGHVKLNYRGWRYIADTPRHVKRSLMLFDKGRYDEVYVREYQLRFRRTTKIKAANTKRKAQINAARRARIAAGSDEPRRNYQNLRARIEGFSGIV